MIWTFSDSQYMERGKGRIVSNLFDLEEIANIAPFPHRAVGISERIGFSWIQPLGLKYLEEWGSRARFGSLSDLDRFD